MTREEILNMPVGHDMNLKVLKVFNGDFPSRWWDLLPDFSGDIKAAWEVHKNIMNRVFSVRKRYFIELQRVVSKEYTESGKTLIAYPDVLVFVKPSHFCRAALLAVMETEAKRDKEKRGAA